MSDSTKQIEKVQLQEILRLISQNLKKKPPKKPRKEPMG